MATYANIQYGSSGEDVRKLQQALIDKGYNVGSSGADGQFGSATLSAVKKYQQDNGLTVDGIAGANTLGKLYAAPAATSPAATTSAATTKTATTAAAATPTNKMPTYTNQYDAQINDIFNKLMNRESFSYDVSADPIYQQYKEQYTQQGKLAMQDTMGQAAALTGGYGSSYGQAVGQQQYDAYLQKLNTVVPELYGQAYQQYTQEGNELSNQHSMLTSREAQDYARYRDDLSQYYNRADSNYNRLVELMTNTGYKPTAQEIADAGMSSAQAKAYQDYYAKQLAAATASSGSSSGGSSKTSSSNQKSTSTTVTAPTQYKTVDTNQGEMGGSYYSTAKQNIKGMSLSAAQKYLRDLKNNGYITASEYTSLVKAAGR